MTCDLFCWYELRPRNQHGNIWQPSHCSNQTAQRFGWQNGKMQLPNKKPIAAHHFGLTKKPLTKKVHSAWLPYASAPFRAQRIGSTYEGTSWLISYETSLSLPWWNWKSAPRLLVKACTLPSCVTHGTKQGLCDSDYVIVLSSLDLSRLALNSVPLPSQVMPVMRCVIWIWWY